MTSSAYGVGAINALRQGARVLLVAAAVVAVVGANAPRSLVSGTVTEDGGPISGALVTLLGDSISRARATYSDDAGRFAFADVPIGAFTLTAAKPNYVPDDVASTARRFAVRSGETVSGLVLRLRRAGVITGSVVDRSGAAIAARFVLARGDAALCRRAGGAADDNAAGRRDSSRTAGRHHCWCSVAASRPTGCAHGQRVLGGRWTDT